MTNFCRFKSILARNLHEKLPEMQVFFRSVFLLPCTERIRTSNCSTLLQFWLVDIMVIDTGIATSEQVNHKRH